MTAGSKKTLSACLPKQGPLGACLKTLLESETWGSVEYYLEWKVKVTRCGSSVFQLAPSMPRNYATDIGSWATPQARDTKGRTQNPDKMNALPNQVAAWSTPTRGDQSMSGSRNTEQSNAHSGQSLTDQLRGDGGAGRIATWPTPGAQDAKHRATNVASAKRRKAGKQIGLQDAMIATWPTPDASSAGKTSRGGDRVDEPLIGGLVRGTWPTPRKCDWEKQSHGHRGANDTIPSAIRATWPTPKSSPSGPDYAQRSRAASGGDDCATALSELGAAPSACLAQTEKFAVRLMVLSAWLMGYPWSYLQNWDRQGDKRRKRSSRTGRC